TSVTATAIIDLIWLKNLLNLRTVKNALHPTKRERTRGEIEKKGRHRHLDVCSVVNRRLWPFAMAARIRRPFTVMATKKSRRFLGLFF
ncbi:MAG: hypothetical protein ACPG7U_05025, partial [Holosporaceae bacterium]